IPARSANRLPGIQIPSPDPGIASPLHQTAAEWRKTGSENHADVDVVLARDDVFVEAAFGFGDHHSHQSLLNRIRAHTLAARQIECAVQSFAPAFVNVKTRAAFSSFQTPLIQLL